MNAAYIGAWMWLAAAAAVGGAGVAAVLSGMLRDAGRGWRRCPRCWYDMRATAGLRCPECGREAKGEAALMKRRRRWSLVAAGLVLVVVGAATGIVPRASVRSVVAWTPRTVVILLWPDVLEDGSALDREIERFVTHDLRPRTLWAWQRRMLARRCGALAEGTATGTRVNSNVFAGTGGLTMTVWGTDPHAILAELGPEGAAAAPALGRAARLGSVESMWTLRELGPLAHRAVGDLIAAVEMGAMGGQPAPAPGASFASGRIITPDGAGNLTLPNGTTIFVPAATTRNRTEAPALEALAAIVDGGSAEVRALCRSAVAIDALGLPESVLRRFGHDAEITAVVIPAAIAQLEDELARSAANPRLTPMDRTATALAAIRILAPHGSGAAAALTGLVERDPANETGRAAIRALGAIGPGASRALGALARARGSDDRFTALEAGVALARIRGDGGAAAEITGELLACLGGGPPESGAADWDVQLLAAELLGELELADARIVPALERASGAGWLLIEKRAPAAIGARAGFDPAAAPALARLLSHASADVRLAAGRALAETGAAGAPALAALERAGRDEDPRVRLAAAVALARVRGAVERE